MGIPYKCDVSDPLELQKMVKKIISEVIKLSLISFFIFTPNFSFTYFPLFCLDNLLFYHYYFYRS